MLKMPAMFEKVFGTAHDRKIKKLQPMLARVNALGASYEKASDAELQAMTALFREKLDNGASLDDILADAFAVVREAAWRSIGMRPYDCQIIGGIFLHEGTIAEMRTGEGKTLVATLPCYLNALQGKGVHVVTVNDYLATRDAAWMGQVHEWLGLSVGCISHGMTNDARRAAYNSDITYGNNSEFGFDFLRDNMKLSVDHMVQKRGHNFAIVDEVDSILIDEARTPLIISGAAEADLENYYRVDKIVPGMKQEIDFVLDEEARSVSLTEAGIDVVEQRLGIENLFLPENIEMLHHVNQALRAHLAFKRDKHYVVENNKVVIVDPHTGRKMPGRRWSDGLHQAIEAKEKIRIEKENETLATITYQKYFLKYDKLSGMTGTADTEAEEFQKIYDVDTVVIPTNRPIARLDHDDVIYKTEPEKFQAVIAEIKECHATRQPVLVGTASVEKSELVHKLLVQAGVPHNVLNAKFHMSEASIVAQAGTPGAVTISTNMAGRGTDIVLGGNAEALAKDEVGDFDPDVEEREVYDRRLKERTAQYKAQCEKDAEFVKGAGGLHVIGTERHEARRIDNQLRGRSGRQGDPGSSRFFLSLEDDLLRIFGSDKLKGLMERLGMEDGEPLIHPWLSKSVGNAQSKVEGRNFGIRKNLLEYDEVMSQQRDAVYGLRNRILGGEDTRAMIMETAREMIAGFVSERTPYKAPPEEMDVEGLNEDLKAQFKLDEVQVTYEQVHMRKAYDVADELIGFIETWYGSKEELIGDENTRYRERYFLLKTTDFLWKKHLQAMSHLRGGIGLRGYGQRNPLLEYKKEGFEMFNMMLDLRDQRVLEELFENLGNERALTEEEKAALLEEQLMAEKAAAAAALERANKMGGSAKANVRARRGVTTGAAARKAMRPVTTVRRETGKVGRNDPCWCGSGKKYKKCHMGNDKENAAAAAAAAASTPPA